MKILLRISVRIGARPTLKSDPAVASSCNPDEVIVLDSDTDIFNRIVELTRDTPGLLLNPIMSFTPSELSKVKYFQPECRHLTREHDRDYKMNSERLEATPFIHTGPNIKIKLLDRIAFSRITLKPNSLSCCDWLAEFIMGAAVADAFERADLTGSSLRPVFHPKTNQPHDGYFHLYSDRIMPLAERDLTTRRIETIGGYDNSELGCLTYDFANNAVPADFNRTAENWGSNFMPVWIVSARVKECYERNRLRGWAFRPVLEKGSELHAKYLEKWEDLLARVSTNPNNLL